MAFVHIKRENPLGRTRSEQAETLQRVYGVSGGMTEEQIDKAKYLEKKIAEKTGAAPWLTGPMVDSVK